MIIDVEGDILLSTAAAIAHVVAPNDDFHSGLALQIRESWPALYKDFRHHCRQSHPEPGSVWAWKGAGSAIVYNLLAQDSAYGQGAKPGKASLSALNQCLGALRKTVDTEGCKTMAMTRLATGVGGLDWKDVEPLIKKHFDDAKVRVYLYTTYHHGQKAVED